MPLVDAAVPAWVAVAGVALLAGFAGQRRRPAAPLVERSHFAGRGFPAALCASTLFFAVATGAPLVVALHEQLVAGQGLYAVPFFTTALLGVRPQETGSAAGLLNAVQQLGGTLGVALLGTVFLRAGAGWALGAAALLVACTLPATLVMLRDGDLQRPTRGT